MLNLTFQLLKLFAEGTLPATLVQALAGAALADGWGQNDEIAKQLAGMGSNGRYTGNVLRDLLRIAKRVGFMDTTPEPYMVKVRGPRNSERTISVGAAPTSSPVGWG